MEEETHRKEKMIERARPRILERTSKSRVIGRHFNNIYRTVHSFTFTDLDDDELEELGIKLSSIDLENPSQDDITFWKPLPMEVLPDIDWEQVKFQHWVEEYNDGPFRVAGNLEKLCSQLRGPLLQNRRLKILVPRMCYPEDGDGNGESTNCEYAWYTTTEMASGSVYIPHCSFSMIHHTDPEEPLRRSEVLPIVAYMRWRMRRFHYVRHSIFPILVVSIFQSHARILQAYHDGIYLRISKSKFYDFKEDNRENYLLFARWFHHIPCGDTSVSLPIEGEELEEKTIEQIELLMKQTVGLV